MNVSAAERTEYYFTTLAHYASVIALLVREVDKPVMPNDGIIPFVNGFPDWSAKAYSSPKNWRIIIGVAWDFIHD